jgi:probable phosphoglycerate mutase
MNHLEHITRLANRYFVMRHGQSKANAARLIVSNLDRDQRGDFGLTDLGREQALTSAEKSGLPVGTLIYASDFTRARQTAEIVREHLGAPAAVTVAAALRERYFGDWDGSDTANYAKVWAADETGRSDDGVESVAAVQDRTTALVAELEHEHRGQDILLVSHGDALQILQTGFRKMSPAQHRSLPHLETAEIRQLET